MAAKATTGTRKKPPWKKPAPRKASHMKLTTSQKNKAKARATAAGRSYPNLIDNMAIAKEAKAPAQKRSTVKDAKTPATGKKPGPKKGAAHKTASKK